MPLSELLRPRREWTSGHAMTADAEPTSPQVSPPQGRARIVGLAGAAAAAIGSLLPWATVGPITVRGTDGDGTITLVVAAIAALFAFRLPNGRGSRILPLIGGLLIAAIGIWDMVDISSQSDGFFEVSIGIGIVITTLGGIALLAAFVLARSERART